MNQSMRLELIDRESEILLVDPAVALTVDAALGGCLEVSEFSEGVQQ